MTKRAKYAVETRVPISQSRHEIEQTLTKFGATSFAFALQPAAATIMFEFNERRIRFDLPIKPGSTERDHRVRWRALLLSIKAKLVSVDTEIETFEEAFLAHVVLADGQKVYEHVRPGIEQQYLTGQMQPLLAGPTTRRKS